MDIATITASIAGIAMAICQIPQAMYVFKTHDTQSISLGMQFILTLGIFMWFVTGVLLHNIPMWLSNGLCLIFCLYILVICIINKTKK